MELSENLGDRYCEYLVEVAPEVDADILNSVEIIISRTNWKQPQSSSDWNNRAVLYLIESDYSEGLESRSQNLQSAMSCLEKGFALDQDPLCAAHYAMIQTMIGESGKASSLAFSTMMGTVPRLYASNTAVNSGLIYLPSRVKHPSELALILQTDNGYAQALMVLAEVLWRSQLVFYNSVGLRSLSIGCQLFSTSPTINLMLGIGRLMCNNNEGIINLHHAQQLEPTNPLILQSLYLGYLTIGNRENASYWLNQAANLRVNLNIDHNAAWEWAKLSFDNSFTCVPFEHNLVMAVEPNLHSIVTSILLGQQDWFEDEMEFWRSSIKAGMTVIDVGANAGVYTFSAANQVGAEGTVIAIEPFSKCVSYLAETCQINNLNQVKVIAAAASDRPDRIKLGISTASELNQIITDAESTNTNFEEVAAITLDSLIETENLQRVDILKVDAEGHEISVFQGAEEILHKFAPIIMYENVSGSKNSSMPVAEFLVERGYKLFRYKPYLCQLIPIDLGSEVPTSLNIIAIKQP